jgi:LysM repeat protein
MEMIEQFARETAAAQTVIASGGTPGTPSTPATAVTGTVITPQPNVTSTNTPPATPTNAGATQAVVVPSVTPGGPTVTPPARPNEWILKKDEFPYCIARRYNVDPLDLLAASGLTSPDVYYEGQRLVIPQNSVWPGDAGSRSLRAHPGTYTVTGSSDTTIYGVACKFGDVDPQAIAQRNGLAVSAVLTVGQQLQIP